MDQGNRRDTWDDDALFEGRTMVLDRDDLDAAREPDERPRGGIIGWALAHQGAAFALCALAFCLIAAAGLWGGFSMITQGADAQAQAASDEADDAVTVDTTFPEIAMRFVSLDDARYPTMTVDLMLARADGEALPTLSSTNFTLTERDDADNAVSATVSSFSLDSATGATSLTFTSATDGVDDDRTLDIALDAESGYRGGCSVSYAVPDEAERADALEGEYVLPDSATHRYTAAELEDYTDEELMVARNEIFARHGRMFGNGELQEHFESTSWYEPRYTAEEFDAMPSPLNDIEVANVNTILSVERSR